MGRLFFLDFFCVIYFLCPVLQNQCLCCRSSGDANIGFHAGNNCIFSCRLIFVAAHDYREVNLATLFINKDTNK